MAVLGLAGMELTSLTAAHIVSCAAFVAKMVLIKCQSFCCCWPVLAHHQVIQARRLKGWATVWEGTQQGERVSLISHLSSKATTHTEALLPSGWALPASGNKRINLLILLCFCVWPLLYSLHCPHLHPRVCPSYFLPLCCWEGESEICRMGSLKASQGTPTAIHLFKICAVIATAFTCHRVKNNLIVDFLIWILQKVGLNINCLYAIPWYRNIILTARKLGTVFLGLL